MMSLKLFTPEKEEMRTKAGLKDIQRMTIGKELFEFVTAIK